MAKKATTVKWALGGDEPDDLQEFLSNEDLVAKNTNKRTKDILWPKKGPHTFVVRRLTMKDNKNGDPRIAAMLVMQNPSKDESAVWNGYMIMDGFNVVEGPGLKFLKRFLKALGLEWADFRDKTKAVEDGERKEIVQIGRLKFGTDAVKDVLVRGTVRVKPADEYNDDEHMEIQSYIALADDDDDEDEDEPEEEVEEFADESDEEEDEADDEDDEDDEDDDEEDDEEDEEEEDDEAEELREELSGLKIAELKKRLVRRLKKDKVDPDDIDIPTKKAALVDFIVQVEMGEPPF